MEEQLAEKAGAEEGEGRGTAWSAVAPTDYSTNDTGQIETRIAAFIEML